MTHFKTLLAAAFIFLTTLASPAHAERAVVGELTAVTGTVTLEHERFGTRKALTGAAVYQNDLIRTAKDSSVTVLFADQNALKVGANAQLRLTKYLIEDKSSGIKAALDLLSGQMRLWTAGHLAGSFQIRTRNAVAGIRGTEFEYAYNTAKDASLLVVLKGQVAFGNQSLPEKDARVIPEGYWGEVKGKNPPGTPVPISNPPAGFALLGR